MSLYNFVLGDDDGIDELLSYVENDFKIEISLDERVVIERADNLLIMDRNFTLYSGSTMSSLISPYETYSLFRSYVMVLEDRALGRFNKCVGQVEDIWRITIKDDNDVW